MTFHFKQKKQWQNFTVPKVSFESIFQFWKEFGDWEGMEDLSQLRKPLRPELPCPDGMVVALHQWLAGDIKASVPHENAWSIRLESILDVFHHHEKPRCSMYGIFAYILPKFMLNVGKYSIHGPCGMVTNMIIKHHQVTWKYMTCEFLEGNFFSNPGQCRPTPLKSTKLSGFNCSHLTSPHFHMCNPRAAQSTRDGHSGNVVTSEGP